MSAFDGVAFRWDGKTVTIPAERLLGCLARLEDVVSLAELAALDGAHPGAAAEGLAAVLRFAGVETDADAVYQAMLPDPEARQDAYAAIGALIEACSPPVRRSRAGGSVAPSLTTRAGLVEGLFKALVGRAGVSVAEFWSMTPRECWWLVEAKTPPRMITPNMTEDEAAEIYAEAYGEDDGDSNP